MALQRIKHLKWGEKEKQTKMEEKMMYKYYHLTTIYVPLYTAYR